MYKRMSLLERNGIPGPRPHLIMGNMYEYYTRGYNDCFERWKKQHGKIFGYYLGAKPFVVITDPELLKVIEVKEFNHFFDRPYVVPGGLYRNPKFHQQLYRVNRVDQDKWRAMRQSMSPWFSSLQLKSMVPTIVQCADDMVKLVAPLAQSNQEFNLYRVFEGVTMDAIHRTAFGVNTGAQKVTDNTPTTGDTNTLMDAHRATLAAKTSEMLASLVLCLPELSLAINAVRDIVERVCDKLGLNQDVLLWESVEKIVNTRLTQRGGSTGPYRDVLELMIAANRLSKTEIVANAIAIDEAAFESPANNLGFIFHHLVNQPDLQRRVYQELRDELVDSDGNPTHMDYQSLNRLPFTDAVIMEAFRIFPTDPLFMSHSPAGDYRYGSVTLPAGVDIRVPTYQLHRDPEYWEEPDVFNPDRFMGNSLKSVNPYVYQPFGVGPRMCPGKRFSVLEIKIILAKLLLNYKVVPGDKTEPIGGLDLEFKLFSLSPRNGISVRLEARN
ncbi:unnamed protein product [Medioppia subpectinata]|uniref:Cytochrome P450 n=1 Tax=Medioppia subpectinata TaxID=1979941 RepID=A0A7R9PYG4_9ACAR|nr:unnamed protein product [Medioppia subpectinata]CAG2105044.1 unnamed protein product [Medioppia subpectinata]